MWTRVFGTSALSGHGGRQVDGRRRNNPKSVDDEGGDDGEQSKTC